MLICPFCDDVASDIGLDRGRLCRLARLHQRLPRNSNKPVGTNGKKHHHADEDPNNEQTFQFFSKSHTTSASALSVGKGDTAGNRTHQNHLECRNRTGVVRYTTGHHLAVSINGKGSLLADWLRQCGLRFSPPTCAATSKNGPLARCNCA